jgi:uncharacterized pyridoxamine 5'-phosphate oxidase family protein
MAKARVFPIEQLAVFAQAPILDKVYPSEEYAVFEILCKVHNN